MPEALTKNNSCLFRRIKDFKVPFADLVIALGEFDNTADSAYLYKKDGTLGSTKTAHPGGTGGGTTDVAKIGSTVYASNAFEPEYPTGFAVYKNGVGHIALENGSVCGGFVATVGGDVWVQTTPIGSSTQEFVKYDVETGLESDRRVISRSYAGLSSTTTSTPNYGVCAAFTDTHFAFVRYNGVTEDEFGDPTIREWLHVHDIDGTNEQIIKTFTWVGGVTQKIMGGVGLTSDRVAVAWHDFNGSQGIDIYDLTGTLKHQITDWGDDVSMLAMTESRLYAGNSSTGAIRTWDITTDELGDKTYTFVRDINTASPYVWKGGA